MKQLNQLLDKLAKDAITDRELIELKSVLKKVSPPNTTIKAALGICTARVDLLMFDYHALKRT